MATWLLSLPPRTDTNPHQLARSSSVSDCDTFTIACYVTGAAAGASGKVDFTFALSPDGIHYDTIAIFTLSPTMNGASTVQQSTTLNISGAKSIKWLSVKNNDSAVAATNLNVILGKHWVAK
jgi:hypothetical protein